MKRLTGFLLCLVSGMIWLGIIGCSQVVTSENFLQKYQLRSGTFVEVYNQNGSVTISGWDQPVIEIAAIKESIHGQEALDEVDIFIDIAETTIIQTVHPSTTARVTVDYVIKMPADLLLNVVECANGNITISNLSGNPVLRTSNGVVEATTINGLVTASSSNGDLTIKAARGLGNLQTANGNIDADLPLLHEDLQIRTSNGSVNLALAPTLPVELEADTVNGSIRITNLNLETLRSEQTKLHGKMNGGGFKLTISTSNGSIDLQPLR